MIILKLLLAVVFLLGFVYLIMGFIAYGHRLESSSEIDALTPWWAFNRDTYDDAGKKLCFYGKVIIFIESISLIIWLILSEMS